MFIWFLEFVTATATASRAKQEAGSTKQEVECLKIEGYNLLGSWVLVPDAINIG